MKKDSFIRWIYTGDNLPILRGMDSETADLIYLDPPFNSGKLFAGEKIFGGGFLRKMCHNDDGTFIVY